MTLRWLNGRGAKAFLLEAAIPGPDIATFGPLSFRRPMVRQVLGIL
jgi:hypothetical protein